MVIASSDDRLNGQIGIVTDYREYSDGRHVTMEIDEDNLWSKVTMKSDRLEVIDHWPNKWGVEDETK